MRISLWRECVAAARRWRRGSTTKSTSAAASRHGSQAKRRCSRGVERHRHRRGHLEREHVLGVVRRARRIAMPPLRIDLVDVRHVPVGRRRRTRARRCPFPRAVRARRSRASVSPGSWLPVTDCQWSGKSARSISSTCGPACKRGRAPKRVSCTPPCSHAAPATPVRRRRSRTPRAAPSRTRRLPRACPRASPSRWGAPCGRRRRARARSRGRVLPSQSLSSRHVGQRVEVVAEVLGQLERAVEFREQRRAVLGASPRSATANLRCACAAAALRASVAPRPRMDAGVVDDGKIGRLHSRILSNDSVVIVGVEARVGRACRSAADDAARAAVLRAGRVHRVLVIVAALAWPAAAARGCRTRRRRDRSGTARPCGSAPGLRGLPWAGRRRRCPAARPAWRARTPAARKETPPPAAMPAAAFRRRARPCDHAPSVAQKPTSA